MTKNLMLASLLLLAAVGCSKRSLVSVEDGITAAGPRTTIVTTIDVKSYVIFASAKKVFWECEEKGSELHCAKRCDVKNENGEKITCQKLNTLAAIR